MDGFRRYVELARKRGPDPYWTPVVPLHRLVSYPLSWLYAALGLTPFAVTMWGLLLFVVGAGLVLTDLSWPLFLAGLVLVKLGNLHDYCDGELARWRIAKGLQSPAKTRVGIFADIWAYTIVLHAALPVVLAAFAVHQGADPWWLVAGAAVAILVVSSYTVGFGQAAYWPQRAPDLLKDSPSLATGAWGPVRLARAAYFQLFETNVFSVHACVVLAVWRHQGGFPLWAQAYVAGVLAVLALAFLTAHVLALRAFDREP